MEDYPRTLLEMERRFSSDEDCRDYLAALRWPEGFICPGCDGRNSWRMRRGLYLCRNCRRQTSVTAGTIFQDSRLPLRLWFRAMWYVTSQKSGVSALGLQRVLGFGSYQTAWAWLQKLRRAMLRPGRDRLTGQVEVDETYWGAEEEGVRGRQIRDKAIIIVAAQADGRGIGRIRMRRIPDLKQASLHGFIRDVVDTGSVVVTDGLPAYQNLNGYVHKPIVVRKQSKAADELLPRVHRIISLVKRWLMGTHQGAVQHDHLDYYLDEFIFRFNRRKSASRGKLFYRLVQQAVQTSPHPYKGLVHPKGLGVVE